MAVKTVQYIFNGQTYNLTLNRDTGKYEAVVTAPSKSSYSQPGNKYGGTVKAIDDAGNTTTVTQADGGVGENLKLRVLEKTPPVITITYPTESGAITNNKPVITWKVTDNDSGVDQNTIGITIDSEMKITGESIHKEKIEDGYQCSYTPLEALGDGSHTIKVDASDYDGNAAEQRTVSFKVDTVPPALNVTSPEEGHVYGNTNIKLSGNTNDATSSPVTVSYQINSGEIKAINVQPNGEFDETIKANDGNNTLTITARDSAGKETIITRRFTIDTGAPVIQSIKITPNPVDTGATFIISVEVTD